MTITFEGVVVFLAGVLVLISFMKEMGAFSKILKSPLNKIKSELKMLAEVNESLQKKVSNTESDLKSLSLMFRRFELIDLMTHHPEKEEIIHEKHREYELAGGNGYEALFYKNYCEQKRIMPVSFIEHISY